VNSLGFRLRLRLALELGIGLSLGPGLVDCKTVGSATPSSRQMIWCVGYLNQMGSSSCSSPEIGLKFLQISVDFAEKK